MILMKNPASRWKAACVAAVFILGRVGQPTRPEVGPVKVRGGGVSPVGGDGARPPKAHLHGHGTDGIPVINSDQLSESDVNANENVKDQQSEAEADVKANVKSTLANIFDYFADALSDRDVKTEGLVDLVDHEDNIGDVEIHGGLENSNVAISEPSESEARTHIGDRRRGSQPGKDADSASLSDIEDNTKPFTFVDGMDRLKAVSHRLRSDKNVNSSSLLVEVRDVAQALLRGLLLVQEHYEKGDEEGAVSALKSSLGNLEYFFKASRGMKAKMNSKGLDILESSTDTRPYNLEEISNAKLAEFLQPQVFNEQIQIVRDTVNILENLDLSLLSSEVDKDTTHESFDSGIALADDEHWQEREDSQETFEFESNAFDFGFAGSQTTFSGQFRPQNFFDHSSLHNLLYQHTAARDQYHALRQSKIGSLFKNDQAVTARHELRINALGNTCGAKCTTVQCNCEKLFGCVQKMSPYDLAVLVAGGFVDTTPTSPNYANFTVSVDDLKLFDADRDIGEKLAQIKANFINVALGKSASQSSTYGNSVASLAVDGDPNTFSLTNNNGDQWWEVDLGQEYAIYTIKLVKSDNDGSVRDRLRNFDIILLDSDQEQVGKIHQVETFYPEKEFLAKDFDASGIPSIEAQYVKVFMSKDRNTDNYLHLGELEAYAVDHTDTAKCKAVLESLWTGCDPSKVSCSNPNTESFHVSVDHICTAVETKTKLLFEVIGDEFDGFVDEGVDAKKHPLSYDVCVEFVAAFDRLYTARPAEYTLKNPMRKNENVVLDGKTWLDIFQHTKFPVGAWFRKDSSTGVVTKSFSGYPSTYYFSIFNPKSGKALQSACGAGLLDMLAHDPSDPNQHFSLSDDGALIPKQCSTKAVSVPGSCHDFAVFKLENLSSLGATDKFKVGVGGTISSGKCPGFFLVSALDAVRQVKDPSDIRVRLEHRKSGKYWSWGSHFGGNYCNDYARSHTTVDKKVQLEDLRNMRNRAENSLFKIIKSEGGQFEIRSRRCNQVSIRATCSERATVEVSGRSRGLVNVAQGKFANQSSTWYDYVASLAVDGDRNTCCHTDNNGDQWWQVDLGQEYAIHTIKLVNRDGQYGPRLRSFDIILLDSDQEQVGQIHQDETFSDKDFLAKDFTASGIPSIKAQYVKVSMPKGNRDDNYLHFAELEVYEDVTQKWRIRADGTLSPVGCEDYAVGFEGDSTGLDTDLKLMQIFPSNPNQRFSAVSIDPVIRPPGEGDHLQSWHFQNVDPGYSYAVTPGFPGRILGQDGAPCTKNDECACDECVQHVCNPNPGLANGAECVDDEDCASNYCRKPLGWDCEDDPCDYKECRDCAGGGCNAPTPVTQHPERIMLKSARDKEVAKYAMHSCDTSMKFLLGSQMSLGTLRAIVSEVQDGPDRMPGKCCFDTPTTNDAYLGLEFDPAVMNCTTPGFWHLGISKEVCSHVGGKWFRSPCVTLKNCIDARPKLFDPGTSQAGTCQDVLKRLSVGFVSSNSQHADYTFEQTPSGCSSFCRSLPDSSNQVGMQTVNTATYKGVHVDGSWRHPYNPPSTACSYFGYNMTEWEAYFGSLQKTHVKQCRGDIEVWNGTVVINDQSFGRRDEGAACGQWEADDYVVKLDEACGLLLIKNCTCMYNIGKVPDKVPDYVAQSPPKFSLISNGKALGISHEISDCTADEISIEVQDFVENSPRQQLYLSHEGQLVSAYCPQRVLTAFSNGNLKATAPYYHLSHVNKQQQQWVYDANSGKISNANQAELFVSSINSNGSTLDSYFFSLMNQGSGLMLGVDGDGCADGQNIVLQKEIAGSLNQKFKFGDNKQIISMKCPSHAITTPDCTLGTALQLQAQAVQNNRWQLGEDGKIKSLDCPTKFIGTGETSQAEFMVFSSNNPPEPLPDNPINFENDTAFNSTSPCGNAAYSERQVPGVGTQIVLSNSGMQHDFFTWSQKNQRFTDLIGPYYFVNGENRVMGIEEGECTDGMTLNSQAYDASKLSQRFYIGNFGAIYSAQCEGGAISMEGSCDEENLLKVRIYKNEESMKWEYKSNGVLQSAKCREQEYVMNVDGDAVRLASPGTGTQESKTWKRENTRLLTTQSGGSLWNQKWTIDFVDKEYDGTSLIGELLGARDTSDATQCSGPNPAFSATFEEFAKESAIKNENNEAQCQHARSQLAFDEDYPFDADVCDAFNEKMCDIEFTHVDHAMESLSGPPQFKSVEHEREVYKKAEYTEKTFQMPVYAQDTFSEDAFKSIGDGKAWENAEDEESSDGDNPSQDNLGLMQDAWLGAQLAQHVAERTFMFYTSDEKCDVVPIILPMPPIPNPAFIACKIAQLVTFGFLSTVLVLAETAAEALFWMFEKATEGPDGEVYANNASRKTYRNLKNLDGYLKHALPIMNDNTKNQHIEMRQHLQGRHLALETNIRRDVIESQNSLGRGIASAQNALGKAIVNAMDANSNQHNAISKWLHKNLCLIYKAQGGTCTGFIGPLHEEQTFTPMVLSWPEGQPNIMDRLERVNEAVTGIENTLTLGMSFKDKGKADQGSESAEADSGEGKVDVMEAKLDAMQDAMQNAMHGQMDEIKGVFNVVNSKMRDAENKMDVMEKRMEDMENKIDDVMNKMDNITDLISRVMQQNIKVIEASA